MTEAEARLWRIARMEETYDQCAGAVEALLQAAQRYAQLKQSLKELEDYYPGPEWREDFLLTGQDRFQRIGSGAF